MNDVIVRSHKWDGALKGRLETPPIAPQQILEHSHAITHEAGDHASVEIFAELRRRSSGVVPIAILGATYRPGTGPLVIRVAATGEYTLGGTRDLRSRLVRRLVSGLPLEYATVVLAEIARSAAELGFPGGIIEVNRGGYDEVDSSKFAFRKAAEFLTWALLKSSSSGFPTEDDISLFLDSLQD